MAIKITARNYATRNHSGGNSFLLFNTGQLVTENLTFSVGFDFTSSSSFQALIVSEYSVRLLGVDVNTLGWLVGDVVNITGTIDPGVGPTWSAAAAALTIAEIDGETITFTTTLDPGASGVIVGAVMPMTAGAAVNTPLLIESARTEPEAVEIYHNLIENSSPASRFSLFDGEVNRFTVSGVDSMAVSDVLSFEQLGNRSGGSYVSATLERLADAGGLKIYKATFVYFNPYLFKEADFETPAFFDASKTLKPSYLLNAYPVANNPNSFLTLQTASVLGNVGFNNESYNQGANDFTIESVNLTVGTSTPVTAVDFNQATAVSVVISGAVDFTDFAEIQFNLIPDLSTVKNKPESQKDLISLSNCWVENSPATVTAVAYGKDSAAMTISAPVLTVGTGETTLAFTLTPSAEFTALLESWPADARRYRLTATVESVGGTANDNNSVTLTLSEGLLEAAPVIGGAYSNVTFNGFFNHSQDIDGVSEIIYNGCTEDDFIYMSLFKLKNGADWSRLDLAVRVVRDSDGQYFDLISRSIPFSQYVEDIDGVIHINYSEPTSQYLDGPNRTALTVANTGAGTSLDYEVRILWPLMASWRYWIAQNDALLEFFDTGLPQDGRSAEWMRYLREAGYSIKVRATLVNDAGVGYYWGSSLNLQDYDDTGDITTTFEILDAEGNPQSALINGDVMTVKAVHTLTSGAWDVGNVWGWVGLRPKESEPMRRISTVWDWTSQNLPLKPEAGEVAATLEFTSPGVAVVTCRIDTTLLNVENYTLVSRIEAPFYPVCVSPVDYLFEAVIAGSDYESDYVSVLDKFLTNGLDVSHANICCPECLVELKSDGSEIYLYAFGRKTLIDGIVAAVVANCCIDVYGGAQACMADFDSVFDTLEAGLTGASLTGLIPSQLNSYGDTDLNSLALRIFDLTSDGVIRWQLVDLILRSGILVTCNPDTGAKTIKKIS